MPHGSFYPPFFVPPPLYHDPTLPPRPEHFSQGLHAAMQEQRGPPPDAPPPYIDMMNMAAMAQDVEGKRHETWCVMV